MYHYLSGGIMVCCLMAGYFFYRFKKKTDDQLFSMFAIAFWILALERVVLMFVGTAQEPKPEIYLIRLSAFIMILVAIIRKNRNA